MRMFIISTAAMLIAIATSASAATVTGTIASIDKKNDSITLVDGRKFTLPEGIEAEALKSGEKVTVTYTMKNGKAVVSSVHPTH